MVDINDLMPKAGDINKVTETIQQPPGGNVTEVHDKSEEANILNQAEAEQQAIQQAATETQPLDKDYIYTIEQGHHKVIIVPQQGLTYNYFAHCQCHWEGRFLTSSDAENAAKSHISRHS